MTLDRSKMQPTQYQIRTPQWIEPIQEGMQAVEQKLHSISEDQHEALSSATLHLLNAGGKRIRPAICLLTAGVFGANYQHSVSLASAVEILHTATLVHDDLIDGALLRRGIPTLNAEMSHDAAVLIGDYLFARAADLVADVEVVEIMKMFARTLMVILNGEITQRFTRWQVEREEYYDRIHAKTATLFMLASKSAAMLGGADSPSLSAIEQFSHSIGMAFQIVDDVLDYTGDADKMGKPNGSDLNQGLITLPLIYYVESNPSDPNLQEILESRSRDHPAIPHVVTAVCQSGAIEDSLLEARQFVARSQEALRDFPASIYVETLATLADAVVERVS